MSRVPPARWKRIETVFRGALEREGEARAAYLDEACEEDEGLRRDVEDLLRAHEVIESEPGRPFLAALDADRARELLDGPEEVVERIGPYVVRHRIARGGMGEVFLARDERLARDVALKLLPAWLAGDAAAHERLVREARAASALDHPNIETVYDIGRTEDGRAYIAMAYYPGGTLRDRIAAGPLEIEEALAIASRVADGLGAAHDRGIVHRDVKPENVVLTPEGVPKLVDFGIAEARGTAGASGGTSGTVAYMSPEQTRGESDPRCDVWALGVVLYEMLTGVRPFREREREALLEAIRDDEPRPLAEMRPEASGALADLVARCLAKDPERRPADGRALAEALAAAGGSAGPGAPPTRPTGRRRAGIALVAIALAIALGVILLRPSGEPPEAERVAIMPLTPVDGDTALARLGQELAVTLGASLDGVGNLRTVEPLAVLARAREGGGSGGDGSADPEAQREIAAALGAGSLVRGTLLRTGDGVRADLTFAEVEGPGRSRRVAVEGSAEDIAAFTDSATLALLRTAWARIDVPAPSLEAITTRSVPALRAYLEGERALADARFDDAVRAFERAFAADSTFWFAYWRSLYPRVYEGSRPDTAIVREIWEHRTGFPEPDRLLLESSREPTLSAMIEARRAITERFPHYWPAWQSLGDLLVHWAPYLGHELAEARPVFERLVALEPRHAAAWVHLLWLDLFERDGEGAARRVARLAEFSTERGLQVNPEQVLFYGLLADLARDGGSFSPDELERQAAFVAGYAGATPPLAFGYGFVDFDFPRAQTQLAEAVLARDPAPAMAWSQHLARGLGLAARGGWDSALVSLDRWVEAGGAGAELVPDAALLAYGFAVTAAGLGEVTPQTARRWRARAAATPAARDAEGRAELAWLDGVLAHAGGDADALDRALDSLRAAGSAFDDLLAGSLAALRADLAGDAAAAGRRLAELELQAAERQLHHRSGRRHPFLNTVNRLFAGRRLHAAGEAARAAALLRWSESVLWNAQRFLDVANRVFHTYALLERARIEDARGRSEEAARLYRDFLDHYDLASGPGTAAVEEAVGALRRLAGEPGG